MFTTLLRFDVGSPHTVRESQQPRADCVLSFPHVGTQEIVLRENVRSR